ncbi:Twitchin [Trichoplax sp. H2]|nr:Twitchin [Trichoplax sp. H2]|eukprot:RDD36207.1 Twitchin [Trichoplax sp. H2]
MPGWGGPNCDIILPSHSKLLPSNYRNEKLILTNQKKRVTRELTTNTNVKLSAIETTSKTATIWWQYSGNSASPDSNRQTLIQYTTEENFRNANIGSGTCGTCQQIAPLTRSPVVILSLEGHTKYVLRVLVILNNNEESILYGDWQHFTTKGHPDLPLVSGMIIENNNAKISYGNITHNGGYDFRDYFLYLQLTLASDPENCGQNCKIVKLPDLKGNVLIENLKENTTYRYRFIAENPVGESNSKWQTFATKGKPDKASISQIVTAPNTATISWNPVTFNGNYKLREVEYRLEYQKWDSKSLPKNVACGDCLQSAVNPADHSHMIVGLNTNTTYSVRLIAINKAGSSYSEWQLMTTKGVPERPQIRNFITTVRVATVSWRPITKNGGYPLNDVTYYVEYQIYVRGTNIGAGNVCRSYQSIRTSNNELISIPNLRQNTTYMVRIVAENKAGRSFSDFTYMATKGLPGNLLPFEVNPGVFTVNVTWKPVAYTGGYDKALITYVVEYAERNSSSDTLITGPCNVCYKRTIPLDSQNYHLTSLKSNTAYILRLTATNAVGTVYGQWSETITKGDAYSAAFNSSGQGYVKIRHTPQRIESTYIVSLRFKPAGTTVKDGLIFFLNNGYEEIIEQTSLLLYLHEKKLEALFVQRDGSLQVKSSVDVEPENWYHATANVSRETLTVTVNGRTQSANLGRTLTFNEFFNYAPYIGGVFDYTFLPVSASIKVVRGFHGCIKRVSVNSVKQDMENPAQQLYSWRCAP